MIRDPNAHNKSVYADNLQAVRFAVPLSRHFTAKQPAYKLRVTEALDQKQAAVISANSKGSHMKSVLFILCTLFLAVSCSGGDNGSEPECGSNSSCPPPQLNPEPGIVGLWDRSGIQDFQQEILYTFIGTEGEFLVYDFEQDDFGSGENCHTLDSGTIYRNTESSNYTIEFQTTESDAVGTSMSSATIFLQGNNVEFSIPESGVQEIWTPVVGLTTDDLELCQ